MFSEGEVLVCTSTRKNYLTYVTLDGNIVKNIIDTSHIRKIKRTANVFDLFISHLTTLSAIQTS
jgi:hypothetical protein